MLKTVVLAKNPFEVDTWTTHEVSDVRQLLAEQFDEWPNTGRIYHGAFSEANDVTPHCAADVERLGNMPGPFYVVIYPGVVNVIYAAIVAFVAIVAVAVIAKASIPNSTLRNTQAQSPNNELSKRSNNARPMARIPDIYGTVRSTPDLIAVPYNLFIDHQEVEYSYLCIGRGEYDIIDICDDTTAVSDISGTSVEVYAPFTSPNFGEPQLRVGAAINTRVLNAVRSNSVNGQVLRAPNDQSVQGSTNVRFATPNEIQLKPGEEVDFTTKFAAGDRLTISNGSDYSTFDTDTQTITASSDGSFQFQINSNVLPSSYVSAVGKDITINSALLTSLDADMFWINAYDLSGVYKVVSVSLVTVGSTYFCRVALSSPAQINPQWAKADGIASTAAIIQVPDGTAIFDLSGTYDVLSVSSDVIRLSNPAAVNANWGTIATTDYVSPLLLTSGDKWIGPFTIDSNNVNQVFANFVAMNGLYKDDGTNQTRFDVTVELEVTPIDENDLPRGVAELFQATIEGSSTIRSTRAVSLKAGPTLPGKYKVRARRVTPADTTFKGTVVDEIKWRDVYAVAPVSNTDFGNVTTVQSVTYATNGALALKDRKLNMLVTRKIDDGYGALVATNNAADILRAVCFDPFIGNRTVSEIDVLNFTDTVNSVIDYFGTAIAGEFNYTFDSDNLSFEEIVSTIADAVFCKAYRRGNVIRLSFERETPDSVLLFNHRNKLPGTEARTVNFGNNNDNDGVEYQYIDPDDDAQVTLYLPADRSAINPKKVESVGIRNKLQAYFHAWRVWNKIRFANQTVEFEATQEADLIIPQDRILVADNTRPDTQDGDVISQYGPELELSHDVTFALNVTYTIFLQHYDGSVEAIDAAPGTAPNRVVLTRPPRLPLAVDDGLYARATYVIVGNNSNRQTAFLVSEKSPNSNFTTNIKAVNYDDRYYVNDSDYKNGIVNTDGNQQN